MPFKFRPGQRGTIFATFINPNGAVPTTISDVKIKIDFNTINDVMTNIVAISDMVQIGGTNSFKFFWNVSSTLKEGTYLATYTATLDSVSIVQSDTIIIEIRNLGGGGFGGTTVVGDEELKKLVNDFRKEVNEKLDELLKDRKLLKDMMKVLSQIVSKISKFSSLIDKKDDFSVKEKGELRRIEKSIQDDIDRIKKSIGQDLSEERLKFLDNLKPILVGSTNEVGEIISNKNKDYIDGHSKILSSKMDVLKGVFESSMQEVSKMDADNVIENHSLMVGVFSEKVGELKRLILESNKKSCGELKKVKGENKELIDEAFKDNHKHLDEIFSALTECITPLFGLTGQIKNFKSEFDEFSKEDKKINLSDMNKINGCFNEILKSFDEFDDKIYDLENKNFDGLEDISSKLSSLPNKNDFNLTDFSIKELIYAFKDDARLNAESFIKELKKVKKNLNEELIYINESIIKKMRVGNVGISSEIDNLSSIKFLEGIKKSREKREKEDNEMTDIVVVKD